MKFTKTLIAGLLVPYSLNAATFIVSDSATNAIPDGSSSGLARQLTVIAPGEVITNVQLTISITALPADEAFLGDLYLYLSHDSDLSVLLNRPGRRAGSIAGYGDDQSINVNFDSAAVNDVHNYRLVLNGDHAAPLTGSLTGIWQPDGRAVDPAIVLDTSPRNAGFDLFNGDNASGTWNLFAADLSSGARHQLTGWTLTLTTATVPEPSVTLLGGLGIFGLLIRRRK